jgi:hypothetical protein
MNQIAREIDYIAKLQGIILTKKRMVRLKNLAMEPFNTPPEGNVPFNEVGSIAGPGTPGTTPILLSVKVPDGWDGLIRFFLPQYTGTNFVNNSANLIWALRIDGLYIKGYQSIGSQFGESPNGMTISPGIIVKSSQLIEVICTVDPGFVPDGGSEIIAQISGFYYPVGVARTN